MLQGGILSGILGRHFPKPVFIGDEITFRLTVLEVIKEKNRVRVETVCFNQRGKAVFTGETLVTPPA
jgi:3-hydroxybutyryl-CoA dehydratase